MAGNSGGYRTRKRITEVEQLLKQVPTDEQIREELFLRVFVGRFVQVPKNRALIHKQWELSLQDGKEEEQAQNRQEIRRRIDSFLEEAGPGIIKEIL